GADGAQRQERDGEAGELNFVEEDVLIDRRPRLPAELFGPADSQPAVFAHLLERRAVERAPPFAAGDLASQILGDESREVGAELVFQRFFLCGVIDVHINLPTYSLARCSLGRSSIA